MRPSMRRWSPVIDATFSFAHSGTPELFGGVAFAAASSSWATVTPSGWPLTSVDVASWIIWKMPGVILPSMPVLESSWRPGGITTRPTRCWALSSVSISTAVDAGIWVLIL